MDQAEKCFFCGRTSPEADLVAWFVQDERRRTHSACWFEAHQSNRPGSSLAPRKTLDDIRRELEAEFPAEAGTAEGRVPVAADLGEDARAVERQRSPLRRGARRRRHAMVAALAGIAGLVLVVVISVAVTRETIRPDAVASAPEEHRGIETRDAEPAAAVLPALLTELDQQLKALRSDLQALGARLERSDSRVAGMESRVRDVESSMRRLADDVASAAATRAAERPVAAPRHTASRPAAVAPPTATPVTAANSERWIPAQHSAPESSPTSNVRSVADVIAPPQPRTEPTTTTDVVPTRAAPAVSDSASPPSAPPKLQDKLRADWHTIKQGFASAGDDFKAGMRDVARKLRGD